MIDLVRDVFWNPSTNESLREATPEPIVAALEMLTHLGDGAVIVGLAVLLYWFGGVYRQRDRVFVIAVGLAGMAIVSGIKGIVALERPDVAVLAFAPEGYGGYSFPSAHALGTAVVYTTLAAVTRIGTARQRYAVAAAIIVVVAYSRVVMGVHYLGDVVVGVLLGLAFVAVIFRDPDPEVGTLFFLSAAITVLAFFLGSTEFATMTIGAALGGSLAWEYVRHNPASPYGASILVLGLIALPLIFLMRGVEVVFTIHPATEVLGYALATGFALLVPNIAQRIDHWPMVERLQQTLPFRGRTIDPTAIQIVSDR